MHCQHFRATVERKISECMQREEDQNPEIPPYIWDRDYSAPPNRHLNHGLMNVSTLYGGHYPTITYSQEDLLHNICENVKDKHRGLDRGGSQVQARTH